VVDFRPSRSANTSSDTYISTKTFNNHQIVDSQSFEVEADYRYYKRAVHKISLDQNGSLILTSGPAALKNPPIPEESTDTMLLATFFVNPYTYDERDISIDLEDNRRYTMRDIGAIETRVENLEYYTSLNLLEKQVQSAQFLDNNGEARYKNGFIVDSFQGHNVGDVFNRDYKASIDRANQVMRPQFTSDSTKLVAASSTLVNNDGRFTLPFTQTPFLSQTDASGTININPFQVVTFVGGIKLDPARDHWVDNISIPSVTTNFQGQLDHFKYLQSMQGTEYGDWRTSTTFAGVVRIAGPRPEYNPGNQEHYAGGQSEYQTHTVSSRTVTSRSLTQVNARYHKFMRSRKVFFTAEGLRPNSDLFLFIGGHNISGHAAPSSLVSSRPEQVIYATTQQKQLTTDSNGAVSGYFWVPNDNMELSKAAYDADPNARVNNARTNSRNGIKIPTGVIDVMLVDNFIYPEFSRTIARSTYSAEGELREFELVTSVSSQSSGVSVQSSDFLRQQKTKNEMISEMGYNPSDSNVAALSDKIVNNYREFPSINRAPEEGGFKYWFETYITGYPNNVINLNYNMNLGGQQHGANSDQNFCTEGNDPISQTFFIPAEIYPNGIFASSLDIFMATKDLNNLPLKIELRPTENGFPSATRAISNSRVTLNPSQINANPTTPTATNVQFDRPIHLVPGEYAVVIMTDSLDYFTYIGTMGDDRLDGSGKIVNQPTLGSLFKSQNARTWTPQQESDLVFKLYQCKFTAGTNFNVVLQANNVGRVAYNANPSTANTAGEYDVASIVMPAYDSLSPFDVDYQIKTKNLGGSVQNFESSLPNQDLVFDVSKEITTDSDLQFKVTYKTSDNNVSPYFDSKETGINLIKNRINAIPTGTFVAETSPTDGYALARYISRKVALGQGLSAKNLKVFVDQNMPAGASVEVYYRVINNNDDTDFNDRPYVLMTRRQASTEVSEDTLKFNEYEYYADDISYAQNGSTYNDFDMFSIKIVMYSTQTAAAPSFRNFRAIALA
jgi:hypothetical protein